MLRDIELQLLIVFSIVLGVTFVETFKILAITQLLYTKRFNNMIIFGIMLTIASLGLTSLINSVALIEDELDKIRSY